MPQKKMAGPATGPATEDAKTQYSPNGHPPLSPRRTGITAVTQTCGLCRLPVTCGQGRWHYSCLGLCRTCYRRPAEHPDTVDCRDCSSKAVSK